MSVNDELTDAPFLMLSVASPETPMLRSITVQFEPASCILTVPFEPVFWPILPKLLLSFMPFLMLSVPVPKLPAPSSMTFCVRSRLTSIFWFAPLREVV